jgi:hypothetical protein
VNLDPSKRIALIIGVVAVACGCSGAGSPKQLSHDRLRSLDGPAESMLRYVPGSPQLLFEVDLRRLRDNPVVGDVVAEFLKQDNVLTPIEKKQVISLLDVDALVVASYDVGTANAQTLTLLRTNAINQHGQGVVVADHVLAVGPESLVAASVEVGVSVADSAIPSVMFSLRSNATLRGSQGYSLRLTAHVPSTAKFLNAIVGLPALPADFSLWADVADDAAIMLVTPLDPGSQPELLRQQLARIAARAEVRQLGLAPSVAEVSLRRGPEVETYSVVIPPGRLRRSMQRISAWQSQAPQLVPQSLQGQP